MRVHIDSGLQLNGHHPDMCLAAGRRDGERHAAIDLLKILPIINLWLINDELPAWLGNLARPDWIVGRCRCSHCHHDEKQE